MRILVAVGGMLLAAVAVSVPPALQCPDIADAHVATAWQEYRAGRLGNAQRAFASARARCPDHTEAQAGLGYIALRNAELDSARALFDRVLRTRPEHTDALAGLGLVEWRSGRYDEARAAFVRGLRTDPSRDDILEHIARLPAPLPPPPVRPAFVRPDSLVYPARVNGERFEVRRGGAWAPFYIRGVNLGAALPGRFPSEFPDSATYAAWIDGMAEMGANTVRVYTLHPPAFYAALAAHNAAHPGRPLRLLHGVWAELPPDDHYYDDAWREAFFGEMERIVDVIHGRADVSHRPGHASGYYTADVSRWTLGFILGREWEPYSVAEFNELYPDRSEFRGRYFAIEGAHAMDVWLAEAMEHLVAYETGKYSAQRPVAYTNWPTLDPMKHPVEMDADDERELRGLDFDRSRRAHNEDEVALAEVPVRTTAAFAAGYFAAFHVYPYFPDFLLHDPVYGSAESPFGRSSYFGYLQDLKRHFPGVPLVIAEYGIPASLGIAHFNPQGWHHGGHTEAAMAAINARLTREIAAAGMAGGILFAWIDEWFKHTWLDEPQERPAHRNRMWWNRMNPEQHYGVNALEPVRRLGETLAQRRAAWDTIRPLYASDDGSRLRAHADEAYLWLYVSGPAARGPRLTVGFDIVNPGTGAMRLPGQRAPATPVGVEYALVIDAAEARMVAAPGVFPVEIQVLPRGASRRDHVSPVADRPTGYFTGSYTQVVAPERRARATSSGRFEPLRVVVNRARIGSDSTNYLGMGYDRGVLRHGPLPDGSWERTPAGDLEVRIPWSLVGVTDPSSRHVAHGGSDLAVQVDDIRIVAAAQDAAGRWQTWPSTGTRRDVAAFTWPTWDEPQFSSRRRPVFDAVGRAWRDLDRHVVRANAAQEAP
jgi:tetratricopeptide (TPR) repeat protein